MHFDVFSSSSSSSKTYLKTVNIRDVPDPDISIRYPVKFRYPVVSGKILPDIYRIIFQFLRLVKLV